jgi:hypothetical protein
VLYITPEIIELISKEINRFAQQLLENATDLKVSPRVNHWIYPNRDEIMKLLAFLELLFQEENTGNICILVSVY